MRATFKVPLAILVLVTEGAVAVGLGLGGLIVNAFWVNESVVNIQAYPWWPTAGRTLGAWLVPIAIFSILIWALNKWVVGVALGWTKGLTRNVGVALVALSVSGSIVGALFFGLFKPHM